MPLDGVRSKVWLCRDMPFVASSSDLVVARCPCRKLGYKGVAGHRAQTATDCCQHGRWGCARTWCREIFQVFCVQLHLANRKHHFIQRLQVSGQFPRLKQLLTAPKYDVNRDPSYWNDTDAWLTENRLSGMLLATLPKVVKRQRL